MVDIQPPSMFHYLPHLKGKRDSLKPALKLSKDRFGGLTQTRRNFVFSNVACILLMYTVFFPVSVVIGIPTIKRERDSYLLQTLDSLLQNLNDEERDDVLVVVFIAEV